MAMVGVGVSMGAGVLVGGAGVAVGVGTLVGLFVGVADGAVGSPGWQARPVVVMAKAISSHREMGTSESRRAGN